MTSQDAWIKFCHRLHAMFIWVALCAISVSFKMNSNTHNTVWQEYMLILISNNISLHITYYFSNYSKKSYAICTGNVDENKNLALIFLYNCKVRKVEKTQMSSSLERYER